MGIDVEHSILHVYTQNGLAEAFIKRLQLIARTKMKLPVSTWGHAILHVVSLVRLRPIANHQYSLIQLMFGHQPNISHLRVFGCVVYVPIALPQHIKMGPQCRLGIYMGFDSPSIIRYLEPLTGDMFTACFAICHFDDTVFPSLGGKKTVPEERQKLTWVVPILSHFDPRSTQCEDEVKRIVHLQSIANQMPDAFNDASKVIKSHIPAINAPIRIDVPVGQNKVVANDSSGARLKRGRPPGSNDSAPRKRKMITHLNPNAIIQEKKTNDTSTIYDS
ncbi:hypothetical protein ACFX2J_002681 [Malus domestica]